MTPDMAKKGYVTVQLKTDDPDVIELADELIADGSITLVEDWTIDPDRSAFEFRTLEGNIVDESAGS